MLDMIAMASVVLLAGNSSGANVDGDVAKPEEKMICRKREETGSLIRKTRVCHTRAEWVRITEEQQQDVESFRTARNGAGQVFTEPK